MAEDEQPETISQERYNAVVRERDALKGQVEESKDSLTDYQKRDAARVALSEVPALHATFMIENNSIGIPAGLKSHIRRGKISRELTHLALHSLSGGDRDVPGRCFDNDVVFLEQAVAGYMDRKAADLLEEGLEEADRLAVELFGKEGFSLHDLRDWETFYYRGFWSDQYREWNIDGLRIMTSLGDYFERNYGLSSLGPVFEGLGDGAMLDEAVREVYSRELESLLEEWRQEVLERVTETGAPEPDGEAPSE